MHSHLFRNQLCSMEQWEGKFSLFNASRKIARAEMGGSEEEKMFSIEFKFNFLYAKSFYIELFQSTCRKRVKCEK